MMMMCLDEVFGPESGMREHFILDVMISGSFENVVVSRKVKHLECTRL
jgi:small basic protein